ncbi:MAG: sugar-binding protein [Oscillospiraceae bacterium]|nr:sugar-binding protein [Oscillospiraceae bacterium]
MKKLFALILSAALMVSVSTVVSADRTKTYEAAKGTAVLDGKMDDAYKAAQVISTTTTAEYVNESDQKNAPTAEVRFLWDDNYLYAYCEVKDSTPSTGYDSENPYNSDSIEIFVDLKNTDTDKDVDLAYDDSAPTAGQFRANTNNDNVTTGLHALFVWGRDNGKLKTITTKTDTGYISEFAIPFSDDFAKAAKEGKLIGIGFQVNDDVNNDNTYEGVSLLSAEDGSAWQYISGLGNLKLTGNTYVAEDTSDDNTDTETQNPTTGDSIYALIAICLISAGLLAFTVKRHKA